MLPGWPELPQRIAAQRFGEVAARLIVSVVGLTLRAHPVPQPLRLTVTVQRISYRRQGIQHKSTAHEQFQRREWRACALRRHCSVDFLQKTQCTCSVPQKSMRCPNCFHNCTVMHYLCKRMSVTTYSAKWVLLPRPLYGFDSWKI